MTSGPTTPSRGPSPLSPFVAGEVLKNLLMRLPSVSRLRKRLFSVQNDPSAEIERQRQLIWGTYYAALEKTGHLGLLPGARVLELGPGPILANGVRFIAHGAASYTAIERYDLFRRDEAVRSAYRDLVEGLEGPLRDRCEGLVRTAPDDAIFDERIVTKRLTIEEAAERLDPGSYDLIVSYNVLEHVQDLRATLASMKTLLKPSGLLLHRVDVSTHTDRADVHPLWQLTIPDPVWTLMYSARAYPNRLRPGTYRQLASELALQTLHYETTTRLTDADVDRIRPWLTERYAATPADDLATLDFVWLVSRSRAAG